MEQRRRSQPLGKRSWIYKYPKTFQVTASLFCVGIFFSKPIYDLFFRPKDYVDFIEPPTTLSRKPITEKANN